MGSIRTFLAIVVVLTHACGGLVGMGGENAVRLFYVISGFLISFVLTEARSYDSPGAFYANRFLRIYPIYLAVAGLSLALFLALSYAPFLATYAELPRLARGLVAASNGLLFGQDWLMFTAIEHGELVFSANFWTSEVPLYKALLVPQAWTLGVELSFYLVAPFVLLRRRTLLLALALSLLIRLALLRSGLGWNDPWNYRFFPSELCLFLLGALSHQHLLPLWRRLPAATLKRAGGAAVAAVIAACVLFPWLPFGEATRSLLLFALFTLVVPATFAFQATTRWDRAIGELSYPIYISHMLVLVLARWGLPRWAVDDRWVLGAATTLGTLVAAWGLDRWVGVPVERLRAAVRARRRRAADGALAPTT